MLKHNENLGSSVDLVRIKLFYLDQSPLRKNSESQRFLLNQLNTRQNNGN